MDVNTAEKGSNVARTGRKTAAGTERKAVLPEKEGIYFSFNMMMHSMFTYVGAVL
jgi:hypothetical protein